MDKEYLTIKEYAKLKGISTQYVYKLLPTKLQPYVATVANRKCLKSQALEVEFATKVGNNSCKLETDFVNNSATVANSDNISSSYSNEEEFKRINNRNEQIIDDLREQLKEKDKQLNELTNHIAEQSLKIAELFENNQKLQLNYQLLLSDVKEQETDDININSDELNNTIENDNISSAIYENAEEKPKKKSIFSIFFK